MGIIIVSDSSSDLLELEGVNYRTVPLRVMFGSNEYVDELGTDVKAMVRALETHEGPSTTSCPNVHEWLEAFEGYDGIFAVTISSGLSGSYSSAEMAAQQYMEKNPGAKVHLFDSKSTGPVLHLIIDKLREGILAGKTYDEIEAETVAYQERVRILYSLDSLTNLARNGRVNPHVARIAGALNIKVIGHASDQGTVELLHKCRGQQRALKTIVREMADRGCLGGTVQIDHCMNEQAATTLKHMIEERFPTARVYLNECGVLCSYYADKGGLIVGYEVHN